MVLTEPPASRGCEWLSWQLVKTPQPQVRDVLRVRDTLGHRPEPTVHRKVPPAAGPWLGLGTCPSVQLARHLSAMCPSWPR